MATQSRSSVSQDLILAARQGLIPASTSRRLGGFRNLFNKELGEWFATRRWLIQGLIWLLIINGMMAFVMFVAPTFDTSAAMSPTEALAGGLGIFFGFTTIFGSIGMVILAQDEIIGEKQSGTAAWVLSKPIARPAFVLTKFFSNLIAAALIILTVPGVVAYGEIYLKSGIALPVGPYIAGWGVVLIGLIFFLALTLMLGTLFDQRGPVLGIAAAVFLGGQIFAQFLPQVGYVLPVNINNIAIFVTMGQPLPPLAISQLASAVILSLVFIVVALWRFGREEF
jgi:ABC-2 type transport system permease protein